MRRNIFGDTVRTKRDKYSRVKYTREDMFFGYLKIAMIILAGYLYFHFVIMGW